MHLHDKTRHNGLNAFMSKSTMLTPDRRQPANQALREKVDRIKAAHQRLKDSADIMAKETLAHVRLGHGEVLPEAHAAQQHLRDLFHEQKDALNELKRQVFAQDLPPSPATPLISAEEMSALLAHRDEV